MHLYLHIPFCKQACHYCDFHFSTNLSQKRPLVEAMVREIEQRHAYLPTNKLQTIYFGGGTPSLLTEAELDLLVNSIHQHFTLVDGFNGQPPEITLEANPDDLADPVRLAMLRRYANRLSIGIQTFDESTLRWMNRAHNANEAKLAVYRAREAGFDNLSIDLIYGVSDSIWSRDLEQALTLNVPHISAYNLTIEPDTAFGRWLAKGKLTAVDESLSARQFTQLSSTLVDAGYVHYEISNFAKPDQYAQHNSAYWQRRPYLGIGPSAHSYDGVSRQHNVANNSLYSKGINTGTTIAEREILTAADQVNEYLLTGLRTIWGCRLSELDAMLGESFLSKQAPTISKLQQTGWLICAENDLKLTESGKLFADRVASELFVE
ncbi:radical SAM family heme chaperone HemW [Fibrella sp. HMF5335]|uniref:Heme chaperone HemW n=1 Tax=Fibrella rubiginis TaxID=2817060 RepID=A0A939GH57_9BACT|nr:radical SAM family heme chaperone HemW [Fibrella rubiginis]MBO0938944.1 radical SAM family heme chaperone HemW [Fibrella rubiginis]